MIHVNFSLYDASCINPLPASDKGFKKKENENQILDCIINSLRLYLRSFTYCSYSVIRCTIFFKKFLISTKNYHQSLGASYRRIFSWNNFFYHSYWYNFKQIKGHTVLVIDFYKYGGSEKNRLSCVLSGVYSSSLSLSVSNSLSSSSSASRMATIFNLKLRS